VQKSKLRSRVSLTISVGCRMRWRGAELDVRCGRRGDGVFGILEYVS
jgi:hypothetical protein